MWNAIFNRGDDPRPRPEPSIPQITKPFGERMLESLDRVRWDARKAGGHLPIAALPQLGRIEDVLVPLLEHLVVNPPSVDEEVAVQGMVTDYLPTTVHAYVGLNREFARTPRADGRTPGDDLMDQLRTLEGAVHELSRAVYAHDAEELQVQGRFLSTKFDRSDLAL